MDMALLARRIVEHGKTKHIIKVFQMENGYNRLYLEVQGHAGKSCTYETHAAKLLDLRRQRDLIDAQIAAVTEAMTFLQAKKVTVPPKRHSRKHPRTAS